MSIRCKMQLENVFAATYGGAKAIFRCIYDPQLVEEDRSFQKATPSGFAEFQIDNITANSLEPVRRNGAVFVCMEAVCADHCIVAVLEKLASLTKAGNA